MCLLLGFLGAKILFDIKSVLFKKIVISLTSIAFVLPTVVACIGLIKVWGGDGVLHLIRLSLNLNKNELTLYGLFGILLAHVFFNAPLFLRVFYNCFQIIPVNYLKKSWDFIQKIKTITEIFMQKIKTMEDCRFMISLFLKLWLDLV